MSDYNVYVYNQKGECPKTIREFLIWEDFVRFLEKCHKRITDEKSKNYHMLSGYTKTGSRKRGEVSATRKWLACDIDDVNREQARDIILGLKHRGLECVIYNTFSCTRDKPRMRVVFKLSRAILVSEYKHFFTCLNRDLGGCIDIQTCHIERLQALPISSSLEGANNFFIHYKGKDLDVDTIMSLLPRVTAPKKLAVTGLRQFNKKSVGRSYKWSGINDCPFVNQVKYHELVATINRDGTGRYHRVYQFIASVVATAKAKQYFIEDDEVLGILQSSTPIWNYLVKKGRDKNIMVEIKNALKFAS